MKRVDCFQMNNLFSETLKKLRTERGLSQTQLGKQLFVNQSTVARWESGIRLPDAAMIAHISGVLDTDVSTLLLTAARSEESPHIIIVDDEKAILTDSLTVLDEVMPAATIRGFIWPQQAIEYAKLNPIALAVLDIELGTARSTPAPTLPWNRRCMMRCSLWNTIRRLHISVCRR